MLYEVITVSGFASKAINKKEATIKAANRAISTGIKSKIRSNSIPDIFRYMVGIEMDFFLFLSNFRLALFTTKLRLYCPFLISKIMGSFVSGSL